MNEEKKKKMESLQKEIWRLDKQREDKKFKATIYTFIGVAVAIYIIWWNIGDFKEIKDYILGVLASALASLFYIYFNMLIFMPLLNAGKNEDALIGQYRERLRELEKEQE